MILVTGATGFIGRHLMARLLDTSHQVRVLTRGMSPIPSEWAGRVDIITGDLLEKDSIPSVLQGVSVIVNLAGVIADPLRMRTVNVEAVRMLVEAARHAGVSRMIHMSSAGVIGMPNARIVTEDAACHPLTRYEQSKYEGERVMLDLAEAYGLDLVVLRPTTVFGEGLRSGKDSLLEWMRVVQRGRFVFLGNGGMANYVYVQDVAEAICQVVKGPVRRSAVYTVADPASLRDFVWAMADALGVRRPMMQVPVWVGYAAAGLLEVGRSFGFPAPLTVARVRALTCRHVYVGNRFRREYPGFTLVGYAEGLKRTVGWYRHDGAGL